jgi:hypothetical protein
MGRLPALPNQSWVEGPGSFPGRLSSRMIHTTGNEYPVPQFMNRVEFDYTEDNFQEAVSNFL